MRKFDWLKLIVALTATGCTAEPGRGFTLPEGNVESGQATFIRLQCHECHSVSGVELPKGEGARDPIIRLGGAVPRTSTYGELVTSIINPSHKLATGYAKSAVAADKKSKMRNYNDVMTVTELIDLVAFLQSRYELKPPEPTHYPMY
jgi:hypothetical protein